jgi:hypothetical protein
MEVLSVEVTVHHGSYPDAGSGDVRGRPPSAREATVERTGRDPPG